MISITYAVSMLLQGSKPGRKQATVQQTRKIYLIGNAIKTSYSYVTRQDQIN